MKNLLKILLITSFVFSQKPRARDLGVNFYGTKNSFF